MKIPAIIQLVGLLAVLICRSVPAWEPATFQFYCGSPAYTGLTMFEQAQMALKSDEDSAAYRDVKQREKSSYDFYRANLGTEVDFPADEDCIPNERKRMLEGFAADALAFYRATGDAQGLRFTSPAPNRLGPVVLDGSGNPTVRLFADPGFSGYGQAWGYSCLGGGLCEWSTTILQFGVHMMANRPPPVAYWLVAHELFHVIQNAQPLSVEGSGVQIPGAFWVKEGTADAIAHHQVRQRYGKSKFPLSVHGSRSFFGLRPYDRGLTWKSGPDDRGPWGHALVTDYNASSFWSHLANRYFDDDYYFLIDWFAVPPQNDDWLEWADDLMRHSDGKITHPFYLVFPDFIANYAAWGEKKYDHIGEETWLQEAFDGCEVVNLSPGRQVQDLEFEMDPISAKCIRVQVDGLDPGMAASVIWMAYDTNSDDLDELHLAASKLGGTLVETGKGLECYEASKRGGKTHLCLDKPFTGQRGEVTPGDEGDWVKTWLGHFQQGQDGQFENLMFVVNTPVKPTDSKHDVNRKYEKQKVKLQIGLERVEMFSSTHGKATTASAGANGIATTASVPMRAGEGTPESQVVNMMSALTGDSEAMSKMMFMQNSPAGTTMNVTGSSEGIEAVFLVHMEVRPGPMGSSDIESELALTLLPEEPIKPGATGTYEAMISGASGSDSGEVVMGAGNGNTGKVEVVEFSDDLLHLKVSGKYCYFSKFDVLTQKCQQVENFNGEIIKPFGWAYDSSHIFSSLDTPGMAEYREWLSEGMSEMFPDQMEPVKADSSGSPGGSSTMPGSSSGRFDSGCDCSCSEFARLERIGDEWQLEAEAREEAGEFPGFPPPEIMSMFSCMGSCGQQWDACEGD